MMYSVSHKRQENEVQESSEERKIIKWKNFKNLRINIGGDSSRMGSLSADVSGGKGIPLEYLTIRRKKKQFHVNYAM